MQLLLLGCHEVGTAATAGAVEGSTVNPKLEKALVSLLLLPQGLHRSWLLVDDLGMLMFFC